MSVRLNTNIGSGPYVGKRLPFADRADGPGNRVLKTVARHSFLTKLLESVPESNMHTNKRLARIDDSSAPGQYNVVFEDGYQHPCDVVIGADGLYGRVRNYVLGEDSPVLKPRWSGSWVVHSIVPIDVALDAIGPELVGFDDPTQTGVMGMNGTFTMYDWMHGRRICLQQSSGMLIASRPQGHEFYLRRPIKNGHRGS